MDHTQEFRTTLGFFGIGEGDRRHLPRIARVIARTAPAALRRFYDRVAATPELARFFTSRGTMDAAAVKQLEHWGHLYGGPLDESYRKRAEQIGLVHARIGLEPRWYIGAYATILNDVLAGLMPMARLNPFDRGGSLAAVQVLVRRALLDMAEGLTSYFVAEEQRRSSVIAAMSEALAGMAGGDFNSRIRDMPQGYGQIEQDFEAMRSHVEAALSAVAEAARNVDAGSAEIRQASDDLAGRTQMQAARLEESAAALSEVTVGLRSTAAGADATRDAITHTEEQTTEGREVVAGAIRAMGDIQRSSQEIGQIIGVIDGIAFQTNLLALNAGVEAARAGDAGRGFAVVASEVRALAQRSADAAADIKRLIAASGQQVDNGVALVGRTGEVFDGITGHIADVSGQVARIAALSADQAAALEHVNTTVREMDFGTQQNAAMVEEANAAARSLAAEAKRLNSLVGSFTLSGKATASAGTPRRHAA